MARARLRLVAVYWVGLGLAALAANGTPHPEAEAALGHTFTLQGVTGTQPLDAGGGYDWDWRGPRDDPEWAWFFNRHGWFPYLLSAYQETGDARYRDTLLATLDDWIVKHPAPGRITFSPAWRPLEAARRLTESWLPIAPGLVALPEFTPERAARFRASLVDHGEHLRSHHAFGGNHLVTEMLALTRLALQFPDLPGAAAWLDYGLDQLARAYDEQIYPDGAHAELSTHYQRVIALNYQQLLNSLRHYQRADLADAWAPRVERLWLYVAAVMTPAGANPLNNDSDREDYRGLLASHAPALLTRPPQTTHFPYAGQTVFRGGPEAAHWAFFEAGPRGTDHDHADHLQFDLALGADEYLVDNGRYTYAPGPWRDYFAGPTGHNVVLLDGRGADARPPRTNTAPSAPRFRREGGFELAWGDAVFSSVTNARVADWRRVVVYAPGAGWVVIDRIVAFGAATLTTQWHWAPGVTLGPPADGGNVLAQAGASALAVAPPGGGTWQTFRGAEPPAQVRGWHSERFNLRAPATQTDYVQPLRGPRVNVWVFRPAGVVNGSELRAELTAESQVRIQAGAASFEVDPEAP